MRRKVSGSNNKVPGNRRDFLHAKLFGFLSQKSVAFDYPKDFFASDVSVLAKKKRVQSWWYHVITKKQRPGC